MKNFIRETFLFASIMAVVAMLSGCMMCPAKNHHGKHQPKPDMISYQYNRAENDDNMVKATIYTRSRHGGDCDMGYIKFKNTDNGMKMYANLTDMRPGVDYTVRVHMCSPCGDGNMCCDKTGTTMNLPMLRAGDSRKLETSQMVPNMRAEQLKNAQIYLQRDGGYNAAWGTLK